MDKKLNLLYFSATDTTAKVVREIANGIGGEIREYDITLPDTRENDIKFDDNDLLIIGVPVYSGRVPKFLMDYFARIKGKNTAAIFIVVYGNRDYDDALLELKNCFEENGFIGIAGGAFIGEHSFTAKVATGRPDDDDLEIAKKFGLDIKEKLNSTEEILHMNKLIVTGNFPYRERSSSSPMELETNDNCINCGVCAKHCPMGAINFNNFKDVDNNKCIRCCSCIKRCPVGAKAINHEMFQKITQGLINNFSTIRHEPVKFI